jgi:hypothetical protein
MSWLLKGEAGARVEGVGSAVEEALEQDEVLSGGLNGEVQAIGEDVKVSPVVAPQAWTHPKEA